MRLATRILVPNGLDPFMGQLPRMCVKFNKRKNISIKVQVNQPSKSLDLILVCSTLFPNGTFNKRASYPKIKCSTHFLCYWSDERDLTLPNTVWGNKTLFLNRFVNTTYERTGFNVLLYYTFPFFQNVLLQKENV